MQIIDENRAERPVGAKRSMTGNYYLGVILILTGLFWLAYNMDLMGHCAADIIFSWPMLFIVTGGYLMAIRRPSAGVIIGGLGIVFLIGKVFDIDISISNIVLPATIIAVGIALLISKKQR